MLLSTFFLLALSICCVWIDKIRISSYGVAPWLICFTSAILCGLIAGILDYVAVIFLLLLLGSGWLSKNSTIPALKSIFMICSVMLALAMALHKIPGFSNPIILNKVQISKDAIPYSLYANFDKAAAGLILLAFFCSRVHSVSETQKLLKSIIIAAISTSIVVFGVALTVGYIHPDFKISTFTLPFLIINLFFVCIAEEIFFRGVIQEQLMRFPGSRGIVKFGAIVGSALLFGLAHFGGGITLIMLSALAGLGYALIYAHTRKIESAVITHFFVNTIHFIAFTYPSLSNIKN